MILEIIETYWNVNDDMSWKNLAKDLEIIETYWNVNNVKIKNEFLNVHEIIETYWNILNMEITNSFSLQPMVSYIHKKISELYENERNTNNENRSNL